MFRNLPTTSLRNRDPMSAQVKERIIGYFKSENQILPYRTNLHPAGAKGLELVFNIDPDVPPALVGDSLRVGQSLINYANNAVKYTETGEVIIGAHVRERSAHDVLLYFSVSDTGIGLTEGRDGLDVQAGLSHTMGKKSLYLAMLHRYVAGQRDCAHNIRLALAAGDAATAQRATHTLKGVSDTIGAKRVSALAGAVETALREQQDSAAGRAAARQTVFGFALAKATPDRGKTL